MSANIHGAISFGIEPDKEWIKLSKSWLKASRMNPLLCIGVGENLPFKDDTFDIVTCNFVLEHAQSPTKIIEEMVRVLRVGGFCYLNIPNYLYPLEQHYGVFWVPFLPKKLAGLYLALRENPLTLITLII